MVRCFRTRTSARTNARCSAASVAASAIASHRLSAKADAPESAGSEIHLQPQRKSDCQQVKSINAILSELTFDDLRDWAGETVLNRGRNYVSRVDQVWHMDGNTLAAWVVGSDRYATSVRIGGVDTLECVCTCPYAWGPCKHGVALVLAAAEYAKRDETISALDADHPLRKALREDSHQEYDSDIDASQHTTDNSKVDAILTEKSREELLDLLTDLSRRFPYVSRHILEKNQLASGQVDGLVQELMAEIQDITAEPAYYNPWRDEGNIPDFSHIEQQLRALVEKGFPDAVLALGEELWTRGIAQVEQSDDEGETADAIAACMGIVSAALPRSSLAPTEQLLWVIDRALDDEFSLLTTSENFLQRPEFTPRHWREIAETLETRLQNLPKPDAPKFSDYYRREKVLDPLLKAYEHAKWNDRIIPRLEQEADASQCYMRLVETLLAAGEKKRARHWCIKGYEHTLKDAPGIASSLQQQLRAIAQEEERFDLVAAYRAQDFFDHPSVSAFGKLRKSAKKAKCWQAVRHLALGFLETGESPIRTNDNEGQSDWPLPVPEVEPRKSESRHWRSGFPDLPALIEIAIFEKRTDDVVDLYQRLAKAERWNRAIDKKVAEAIADSHSNLALDIWMGIVNSLIAEVKPKAYEEAAIYLRLMERTFAQNGRLDDWQRLLAELRTKHKAKRRLLGVLDSLSKRKLVD